MILDDIATLTASLSMRFYHYVVQWHRGEVMPLQMPIITLTLQETDCKLNASSVLSKSSYLTSKSPCARLRPDQHADFSINRFLRKALQRPVPGQGFVIGCTPVRRPIKEVRSFHKTCSCQQRIRFRCHCSPRIKQCASRITICYAQSLLGVVHFKPYRSADAGPAEHPSEEGPIAVPSENHFRMPLKR